MNDAFKVLNLGPAAIVADYIHTRAQLLAAHIRQKQLWFKLEVAIDASPRRRGSNGGHRGGKPHISIATFHLIANAHRPIDFIEYASIRHLPHIGSLKKVEWRIYADALIAHEVAHAYLWTYKGGRHNDHHGRNWQQIYAGLRAWLLAQPR